MSPTLSATPGTWLMAALPIAVVLFLMAGLRWGGTKAGPAGWLIGLVVAAALFGAGPAVLVASQVKGLLLSLFVLYIIWMALALYQVVRQAGALEVISVGLVRLTADRTMQLLLLAWIFASFLQGVTGFGVPVAVVAPLLVGLGFPALASVVAASVGHSWAVTFGSLASSFTAMMAVTGTDGPTLAPWSAALLGLACLPCGLVPAYLHRGWPSVRHALPFVALLALAMGGAQYVLATHRLWNLAAFGAGLVGLVVAAAIVRLPRYRGSADERAAAEKHVADADLGMGLAAALSAYVALLVVVVSAQLVPPVHDVLNRVVLAVPLPETRTALGWVNAAGTARTISVFGHAGAQILYASLIGFAVYRALGAYEPGAARRIAAATLRGARKPTIGIVSLVGMALFMADTGMTFVLADGLARVTGSAFPLVAPVIGALGAFMTGSNTNSNVLFAPLQNETAALLGLDALLILGAQNLGGAIGSMFAPAKVIVGCSTVGLAGGEGEALRLNLVYGMIIVLAGGVLTALLVALV